MNNFCVDLEIAKELKKNGFPQETEFYWCKHKINSKKIFLDNGACWKLCREFPAPSSDEILKELPNNLFGCSLQIDRTEVAYYVWYLPIGTDIDARPKEFVPGNCDVKLSNALARKWLYLKKAGYIKCS